MLADYLAGHKIPDVKRAYWIVNPEDLKKKYIEVLPFLSIEGVKVKEIKNEDYQKLRIWSKR